MPTILRSAGKKTLALLLILLTLYSPFSGLPVPALGALNDLPSEMTDNIYLDALQYLGYDVAQLKADNKLFQSGYFGSGAYGTSGNLTNSKYWSGIDYDDNYVVTGLETDGNGKPNLTRFKTYGLCCASFLSYFYFNYLPNVRGITTENSEGLALLYEYCRKNSYNWQSAGKMGKALVDMVADGKAAQVATANDYDALEIGDIVVWYNSQGTGYGHVAIYIGTDGTNHFVAHVGNYRGPEISTIETMDKWSGMAFRGGYRPPPVVEERGRIEITKQDADTGAALPGAVFTLYLNGTAVGSATTDAQGKAVFDDLTLGTYTIAETAAPDGYLLDTAPKTVTLSKSSPVTDNVYVESLLWQNTPETGAVAVKKTDDVGTPLPGVRFGIFSDSGCMESVGTMITGSDGVASLNGLRPGTYYVRETSPKDEGYIPLYTVWTVAVSANATIYVGGSDVTPIVNDRKGRLTLTKTDDAGTVLGAGYVFGIFRDENCSVLLHEMVTGNDGTCLSPWLTAGDYFVKEIALPEDDPLHALNPAIYPVTAEKGQIVSVNGGTVPNDRKKWQVTVTKIDNDTGTPQGDGVLSGAVYGLYDHTGTLLAQYTTDENGTFTTQIYLAGKGYYLQEITPSPGYQLDDTRYDLDAYADPAQFTVALNVQAVTVTERVIRGKIQITKSVLDPVSGTRTPEGGAVFRYYLKSAGSYDHAAVKGEFVSDEHGIAMTPDLPYGTYVITQVQGAAGAEHMDDFEITVDTHGKTYVFERDDTLWSAGLCIVKREIHTDTPLIAEFKLYDGNTLIETRSTGKDGRLTFTSSLVYGKTYYVKESPLAGYLPNNTIYTFTCTQPQQTITHRVDNIPAESSIYLQKKAVNGTPLAGVQVLLEYSVDNSATWHPIRGRSESDPIQIGFCDAALLNRDGSMTTDANGTIRFTGLRQDTQLQEIRYRVTEIQTVNGCTLLPETIWIGHLPMDINGESVGDLSVTVTNGPGFALPRTGTCQTPGWVLAGSCTGTLGLWTTCYFIVRKKRRTHFGKDN